MALELPVLENRPIGRSTRLLSLSAKELKTPLPAPMKALGRFARLRAWPGPPYFGGPLLDRPFSIHSADSEKIEFLIRVAGQGTGILSSLSPWDKVRLIGPLGRGLDEACPDFQDREWHLVAGGAGLGPMGSVVKALGKKRARLFYGEREAKSLIDLKALFPGIDTSSASEDGLGPGPKGLVTEILEKALKKDPRPVFACGPNPMLAAVSKIGDSAGVPVFASVEARMACGLGACLSCQVPKKGGGSFNACKDGPVMDAGLIDWEDIR